jgi:hypothetical protein
MIAYFIRRSSDRCSVIKLHPDNEEEVVQSGLTLLEAEILCAAKTPTCRNPPRCRLAMTILRRGPSNLAATPGNWR